IFYSILRQMLIKGRYHADLHGGNIMLRLARRLNYFLDFGNTGRLSWVNRWRFIGLLIGLRLARPDMVVCMLERMGQRTAFSNALKADLGVIAGDRTRPIDVRVRDLKARLEKDGVVFQGEFEVVFKVFATIQYVTEVLSQKDMDRIAMRVLAEKVFPPL